MFSSNSRPKFYDDPTATYLLKAMSKSVSTISGHQLVVLSRMSRHVSVACHVTVAVVEVDTDA